MDTELIERIKSDTVSSYKKGATQSQIASAQKKLGVIFPPSYQEFLRHFNGGEFRFARMYRITPSGAGFFDLDEQLAMASEYYPTFRDRELLLFGDDYSGNYYCFDLKRIGPDGEGHVVRWDRWSSAKKGPIREANSFGDFLRQGLLHDSDEAE